MKIEGINNPVKFINHNDSAAKAVKKFSFESFLSKTINTLDQAEKISNVLDEKLATGNISNLHDAMIAAQKAEITMNFALEVRAQVLEAYRELMRIQV